MEVVSRELSKVHWRHSKEGLLEETPCHQRHEGWAQEAEMPQGRKGVTWQVLERSLMWNRVTWEVGGEIREADCALLRCLDPTLSVQRRNSMLYVTKEVSVCWVKIRWRGGAPEQNKRPL